MQFFKFISVMTVASVSSLALYSCQKSVGNSLNQQNHATAEFPEEIRYNEHVRPILSDKCFLCHGPDTANNKAGLRLDTPEDAYADLKESSGKAIVPGDLAKSESWKRIISEDPGEIMPTPESNLALSHYEKEIIKRWIEQGAEYEKHWAFVSVPEEIEVPSVGQDWTSNEIDQFILNTLQEEGLSPTQAAPPRRWLRRTTLDITGLPPTENDLNTFEKAFAANPATAKEAAVDRLLASSAYGEHRTRFWLDTARYADSYGYQSDTLFTPWPYRDWVIRAFNENMPYDQFITWNLAGDLLPNPSEDQILATAFNRLHRLTNEGGSVPLEFFIEGVADRVHTVGTAFMALTMECVRCHDHKYDPITMTDYYGMSAFFNSIDETGLYDYVTKSPPPSLLLPSKQQKQDLKQGREAIAAKINELETVRKNGETRFQTWLNNGKKTEAFVDQVGHFTFEEENTFTNKASTKPLKGKSDASTLIDSPYGKAISFDGDNGVAFPDLLAIDRTDAFSFSMWLKDSKQNTDPVVVAQRNFGTDVGYNGVDLMLEDGYLVGRIYRAWPGNGIGVKSKTQIPQDEWVHIAYTYDGSSKAANIRLYLNGEELKTEILRDRIWKSASINAWQQGDFTIGKRFRERGFKNGAIDELRMFTRDLTAIELRAIATNTDLNSVLGNASEEELRAYYFSAVDERSRELKQELRQARVSYVLEEEKQLEVPVMEEMDEPRQAYILDRGVYDAPRTEDKKVDRVTIDVLSDYPEGAPKNRLGFAQWLVADNHPLTSRVFVNRIWQQFFGQGIVATSDNFGLQGNLPSHPELLDWLSRDFMNNGWDIKALIKKIALSSTYAQDSSATAEIRTRDPENILLARGPALRLDAEVIRDQALASSGLLVDKLGGPPVYPYQPGKDLWRESNQMSAAYKQGGGEDLYRRSVYSVWKRTAPLPNMMAFDTTTREVCTVKRARTNTPLQALVLLNDVQFVEAAKLLAITTLIDTKHSESESIQLAWERSTSEKITDNEMRLLSELYAEQVAYFDKEPERAAKLLQAGETTIPSEFDSIQAAAMTVVCQAILNTDATVWKR